MAKNKLEAVVVAIGTDIKNLQKAINDKEAGSGITEHQLNEAIKQLKTEILGEGVPGILTLSKRLQIKLALSIATPVKQSWLS